MENVAREDENFLNAPSIQCNARLQVQHKFDLANFYSYH